MTEKRYSLLYGIDENPYEWDIIDNEKNSIIYQSNGIAICNELNELAEENIKQQTQLKKVLKKQLDYYTERALLLNQPYGDVTEAIHNIVGELGVDLE